MGPLRDSEGIPLIDMIADAPPAQVVCAPRKELKPTFEKDGFILIAHGVLSGGVTLFELWADKDGKFMITVTDTAGSTCLMGGGSRFDFKITIPGESI